MPSHLLSNQQLSNFCTARCWNETTTLRACRCRLTCYMCCPSCCGRSHEQGTKALLPLARALS
eukprot:5037124-Amphidinium_carterae.1